MYLSQTPPPPPPPKPLSAPLLARKKANSGPRQSACGPAGESREGAALFGGGLGVPSPPPPTPTHPDSRQGSERSPEQGRAHGRAPLRLAYSLGQAGPILISRDVVGWEDQVADGSDAVFDKDLGVAADVVLDLWLLLVGQRRHSILFPVEGWDLIGEALL